MEIDPVIQRALGLLISRKPDSTEKLKQMLFESLGREYVPPSIPKMEGKLKTQHSHSHDSMESIDDDEANDMAADTDCETDVGGAKNDDTMDADDFAFDMGISCVICRQFDVSSNNQLLECQECHSLYHQLCHKPAVEDGQDASDPRFVWYCYKCSSAAKGSPEKIKSGKNAEDSTSVKKEPGDSSKKTDKKSEKSSGETKKASEASKDKKLKSDKKLKDKVADKGKDSEKEKVKKHKSTSKESKAEDSGHTRKEKDKVGSKSGDSTKSSSNSGTSSSKATTGSSKTASSKDKGSESRAEKHKQSSSNTSSDPKHKKPESHEKEKKAKKIKKEKAE